ncbi:pantoate--beta-alanine ligase [Candidatus Kinetoplastibacterium desouzaii TCC079E]|uniref:Pantothenate synthetase n=1 Tax=Candidatus Kinetoplastidibacterium desouzai TCC079E TaxID=1208919 RepID=M1LSU1_9PROT|nr:pantoate--beta-alanine ligase [Candidatus Kinetoplastibacterium desouzaii]AGF47176.1 pantoate--beta-alanine ligase [Candidatus Kinetoplastibacterium desouzaii TCC079E]
MIIVNSLEKIRDYLPKDGSIISFVPTMGSLHDGHLKLIEKARNISDYVVVSIFVNRLQFGPKEDFDKYPRSIESDIDILYKKSNVDLLFIPEEKDIYPQEQNFFVKIPAQIGESLEGKIRPGFFSGVCTVLLKFFSNILPNIVILGKKDYQQLTVVKNMCSQFLLPINIVGQETIRCSDGLAFSSRNTYLTKEEREEAPNLYRILSKLREEIISKKPHLLLSELFQMEEMAYVELQKRGWVTDYITVRTQDKLNTPNSDDIFSSSLVILGAAKLGSTRLIDNIEI